MKRAIALLLTAALSACSSSSHANVPPPPPPETQKPERPAVVKRAIAKAHKKLKESLAKDFPAADIELREEDGPWGTIIAVAAYPKAYPGTGVRRLVIDGATGVSYGKDGDRTFADFAREHGWTTSPPETDQLIRFVNTALFDGIAILDDDPPAKVAVGKHTLRIELVHRFMPSHSGEWIIVTVPHELGPETVERKPLNE